MRARGATSSGWRQAMLTVAALVALAVIGLARGDGTEDSPTLTAMALIFHGVMLAAVAFWLTRLDRLTEGRPETRGITRAALLIGIAAGLTLFGRDFGII